MGIFVVVALHLLIFCLLYRPRKVGILRSRWQLGKKGDNLFRQVSTINPAQVGFDPQNWEKPAIQYKFYPAVIKELIALNRKWGTPLQGPWKRLKRDLYNDLQWQKRSEAIVKEAVFHQILMSSFVLFFAWSFQAINPGSASLLLELLLFYLLGLAILLFVVRALEKRVLGEGSELWCGIIRLELFYQAKLSVQEVLLHSNIVPALQGKDSDFSSMRQILKTAIDSWQKLGQPIGDILLDMRQEYAFIVEQKMDVLLKRLKLIQMGMALFFILPSFFYLLSVSMDNFLF